MNAITELFHRITVEEATRDRIAMIVNGWPITRNVDKRTFQKGWTTEQATVEMVTTDEAWLHRTSLSTGIRIENGIAAIDVDVDDHLAETIRAAILRAFPALKDALLRFGKGYKFALFCRTSEPFGRLHTSKFLKPGTTADDGAYCAEIFGGGSPRQFGAVGYHTAPRRGVEPIFYRWEGRSPLDTRADELPALTKKQFFKILDIVENILDAAGWSPVEFTTKGENKTNWVHDLTEGMVFRCSDWVDRTLADLQALGAYGLQGLRCSASFTDPTAKRRDRCQIATTRDGRLVITDHDGTVKHVAKPDTSLMENIPAKLARLFEVTGQ
ncbi:hypothetical protein EOA33_24090 [Mesorhizobium sp. M4A.F.Ca.ET.050.02.1.1]|uniref:hypothetical protein n=1 Tax=Mesorhizobium sp. M4A.F.Ca.ET.050.02.1.1 TaxID=2496754 RepID=UPI000FCC0B43|nr:hypothetical protein [Mesorhizobium sp. M4A.F.Ca.ET.050.02.1.1]RUX45426.1 hypothetical protein EOA33_24090 [Mesorhizobium sp. M4A.F.Ca.ET.050.02.1.1]